MSDIDSSRSNRANIDDCVIEIYELLREDTKDKDSISLERSPFPTLKDIFMLSASFGYQKGSRRKLSSGKKTTIRMEVFSDSDIALLKAMAIAETGDIEVLRNMGDILTIAEEYAQAGIYEVKEQLIDQGGKPLWNLVGVLNE